MKHKLKISVLKNPSGTGIVSCKRVSLKERIFKKLFGETKKVIVLVPGDTVKEIAIEEIANEGGNE